MVNSRSSVELHEENAGVKLRFVNFSILFALAGSILQKLKKSA